MTKARELGDNAQNTKPKVIDAKGDLIVGTGSDAANRLAAGSNGDTLVADSSASVGLSYKADFAAGKNKIINGDFNINQRGWSSSTNPSTAYLFDRTNGYAGTAGGASAVFSAQTFTPGSAPVSGYEASNYLRIVTTSQDATDSIVFPQQRIEDVKTLAGQTVTISFWAKASSGTPQVFPELIQNFGSGGSPSSAVQTGFGKITLSTSWARYSATATLPSLSGKTIGTTANSSFLAFQIWVSAGTTYNARTDSLGAQNNTFEFWGLQVEAGSVATAFQTATGTLAGELAACQRYYYRTNSALASNNRMTILPVINDSTTQSFGVFFHPVQMRGNPTFAVSTAGDWALARGGAAVTGFISVRNSPYASYLRTTVASGLTAGDGEFVMANDNNTAWMEFSAEL